MNKKLDLPVNVINRLLQQEQEAGCINSLSDLAASQRRRSSIERCWQIIQTELASMNQQIKKLPALPPEEHILWAQSVLAMHDLAFLELDTTGLDEQDEIIRLTLVDRSLTTIDDFLIKPTTRQLSAGASRVNGIQMEQLEQEGLSIKDAWERIRIALSGRYIVSYSQGWDVQQLKKTSTRHHLEPLMVIGDDLQRHTHLYYHRENNLTLASICERIGHPLPAHPNQTSLDRARGQVHIMIAMANAVTDVRPAKTNAPSTGHEDTLDIDGFEETNERPF